MIARQCQRDRDQPERLPARAAEIGGGFEQRVVHALERGVDRQHHERQVGVDDADEDREVGREPDRRRVDDAEREQRLVEQAVALQDRHPGVDADQERGPERQHDQHEQHALPAPRRARHAVGDRESDQQQHRGRGERDAEAAAVGREIERVAHQPRIACERQAGEEIAQPREAVAEIELRQIGRLRGRVLRQADLEHQQERHQEEHTEPQIRNQDDEALAPRLVSGGADRLRSRAHRVSTTPASAAHDSQTRSPMCDPALDETRDVGGGGFDHEAVGEPHLVDREVAEIADLPDLAFGAVDAVRRRLTADPDLLGTQRDGDGVADLRLGRRRAQRADRRRCDGRCAARLSRPRVPSSKFTSPMKSATQREFGCS